MRKVLETLMPLRVPVSSLTWREATVNRQVFQGNQDHVTHISLQAVLLTG